MSPVSTIKSAEALERMEKVDTLEASMDIGDAAAASGISAKMMRYYESTGLIPRAGRSSSDYRTYGDREIETPHFIRRTRDFGLPMDRVKLLVGLWQDASRPSREVKKLALEQVGQLEAKIGELTAMKDALADLARRCRGDGRPDCPILRDLAGSAATVPHARPSLRPRTAGLRY